MNDNKLLLVITAIDQQYRHSAFPSTLRNNVQELLEFNVKKHILFEADQKGEFLHCHQKKQNHNPL